MLKQIFLKGLILLMAIGLLTVTLFSGAWLFRRIGRPSAQSAEGLLLKADEFAWNNNWLAANPLYAHAEQLFQKRNDRSHELYAHVSQFAVRMERDDLPTLIDELRFDLSLPAANPPDVRLRLLEMKARCEEEYDAGVATQTFAQVQALAWKERKPYLASRASGEQGILAFTTGDLAEAASRVKRAYAIAKYLGDPAGHIRYAEMIGAGLAHMRRPQQALRFLDEAITTQEKHPEVAKPFVAFVSKVDCLNQLGRQIEALRSADKALTYPRQYHLAGQMQSILATRSDVLVTMGRLQDAVAGYREAISYAKQVGSWRAITEIDGKLAILYERLGQLPSALDAVDEAVSANEQTPREMFQVPGNLSTKARLEAKLGHRAAAESLYQKGAAILDLLLAHVPTPETERLVMAELSDLYSGYFELLTDQGRYAEAFSVIEGAHGRLEAQQLEFDHTDDPHKPTNADKQLQAFEVELLRQDNGDNRAQVLKVFRGINNGSQNAVVERTTSLKDLQTELGKDEVLIEYVLSAPVSYALAITHSEVSRYQLPAKDVIEREAVSYRNALRNKKTDAVLGAKLFADVLGFTDGKFSSKRLIVVPDGALNLLPFSALLAKPNSYLLAEMPLSITPSGTVLALLRSRGSNVVTTLPYLGVAAWTESNTTKPWTLVRSVFANSTSKDLPALPESGNEVESIAAMMAPPSTVLLGHAATKAKFQQMPLGDYRILHLALHGLVDPVFPDRSALVFAPVGNDDGRLEAKDIRQLRLHADLVTLSACDTGVGPVSPSGVESIVAAFLEAGARSVVSTLWKLDDHSSNKLMKDFYSKLGQMTEADALRQAKLDLLKSGLPPYYWASFEIVGDSQRLWSATKQ